MVNMKTDTTVRITPSQNLISTIYRQSWHPVASTKSAIDKKTSRNATSSLSGNLQNAESPFYPPRTSQSRRRERVNSASSHRKIAPPPTRCYPRIQTTSETTYQLENDFEPTKQRPKFEIGQDIPSYNSITVADLRNTTMNLSTWRRKLSTCVNTKKEDPIKPDVAQSQTINRSREVEPKPETVIQPKNKNWPSIENNSKKNYKICSYSNTTLAKICLQGKSPPVKERPINRLACTRAKNTSSSSSIYTENVIFDKTKVETDNKTEGEDKAIDSSPLQSESSQESPISDMEFGNGCNLNENNNIAETKTILEQDENVFDEFQDSDISENELTSTDDECNEMAVDQNISKSEQEHFKQLYEKENLSTVASSVDETFTNEEVASNSSQASPEPEKYEFCSFLPSSLEKYNLSELASLPYDVDWRSCVTTSDLTPGSRHKTKQRHSKDYYTRRRAKQLKIREAMETILERILSFERHQSQTVTQELTRRYHNLHHRQNNKHKTTNTNGKTSSPPSTSTTAAPSDSLDSSTPVTPSTSNNKQSTVRCTWSQRRQSLPSKSMRLAWATEVGQGDNSVFKQACDSGDLTILHNHWLACTDKRNRRGSDTPRRNSVSSARNFTPEQPVAKRHRVLTYKPYTYESSERIKDDKHYHSLSFTSPRTCAACRERARKLRQSHSSCAVRRPSTVAGFTPQTTSRSENSTLSRPRTNSNSYYKTRFLKQTTVLQSVDISSIIRKQCLRINDENKL